MEPLGRLFNAMTTATTAKTYCDITVARGAWIALTGATSGPATVYIAQDAAATGEQSFTSTYGDGITVYWTWAAGKWTKQTQAAAATFTATTGGLAAVFVGGYALNAGFTHITASHASGSFLILPTDLVVQRRPSSLRSTSA